MPNSLLIQQIDTDIADAERLIAELRFAIALTQSAGGDTSESEARLHRMMMVSMLLRDQRQKAAGQDPILVQEGEMQRSAPGPSAAMQEVEMPNPERSPNEDQP